MHRLTVLLALAFFAAPLRADTPKVTVDIPPVYGMVASVMGDLGQPQLIINGAFDPHHFTLKPSTARKISQSELFIWVGEPLTPWMEGTLVNLAPNAAHLELIHTPDLPLIYIGEKSHNDHGAHDDHDEHKDETAQAEHTDHQGHAHENGSIDPHAWLDPNIMHIWLGVIAGKLAEMDPENAATYAKNAQQAQNSLLQKTHAIEHELGHLHGAGFISDHDSYQYFARAFGVTYLGGLGDSHAHSPSPTRLRKIQSATANLDKICILSENDQQTDLYAAVFANSAYDLHSVSPLGVSHAAQANSHEQVLADIAQALENCAGHGH